MLASCQGDVEFGQALLVDEEQHRDDGQAFLLDFGLEFAQFAFGEQQLAVAFGIVVVVGAFVVFSDVHAYHKQFISFIGAIGFSQAGFAVADRLDFSASKDNAGSERFHQEILMFGALVFDIDIVVARFLIHFDSSYNVQQ